MAEKRTRLGMWGATLLLIGAAALAMSCDSGGGESDPSGASGTPTASSNQPSIPPESALERYVERRLFQGFVRNCDEAERPDDIGKQCATFLGSRDDLVAYALGPTFSEYTRIFILEPSGDDWTILHLEVRGPDDAPIPGIPWPLRLGATIAVTVTESCLQSRERPGTQAAPTACLENGTLATLTQGPVEIDEHQWWYLEGYGWSSSNWLRYPEEVGVDQGPADTPEP